MSSINFSKLLSQSGALLQHLSRAYDHRSQLVALESIEARSQLMKFGLIALAVLMSGLLGVIMLSLIIAAVVWPLENRVQILGLITLGLAGIAIALAFLLQRKFHAWTPWSETRQQLREDCESLGEMIKDAGDDES